MERASVAMGAENFTTASGIEKGQPRSAPTAQRIGLALQQIALIFCAAPQETRRENATESRMDQLAVVSWKPSLGGV